MNVFWVVLSVVAWNAVAGFTLIELQSEEADMDSGMSAAAQAAAQAAAGSAALADFSL